MYFWRYWFTAKGVHHLTNNGIAPVVHPPCGLPIVLQDAVKKELDSFVEANI